MGRNRQPDMNMVNPNYVICDNPLLQLSSDQNYACLLYAGDYTTQLYRNCN